MMSYHRLRKNFIDPWEKKITGCPTDKVYKVVEISSTFTSCNIKVMNTLMQQ